MSEPQSPWTHPPKRPRAPARRVRPAIWIGFVILLGLAIWGLSQLFPHSLSSGEDRAQLIGGLMFLTIVSAGLLRSRVAPKEALRNIAVWAVVFAVLAVGYSFRNELGAVLTRVRSEFAGGYPVAVGAHEMVVTQDEDGSFYIVGQVNGVAVRFLVDTGASDIVLSPADAQALGVDLASLHFTGESETANGIGHGAAYTASSLAIGPIRLADTPMQINQAPMRYSLLGMAFFKRLESFQVKDGRLFLRWKQ